MKKNNVVTQYANENNLNDEQEINIKILMISSAFVLKLLNVVVYNWKTNQFKHACIHKFRKISQLRVCLVYMSFGLQLLSLCESIANVAATNVVSTEMVDTPSDVDDDGRYGYSVATNGNFTIIGSPNDDSYNGSAYIYDHNSMEFTKLTANDGSRGDYFGYSVAIVDDIVVVGARADDDGGRASGSAYIFQYCTDTETWNQTTKLTASDAASNNWFGTSVGIAKYDDYYNVIVGRSSDKAYIFRYNSSNGGWNQHTILADDYFGSSVAIDNEFAIVGSPSDGVLGVHSGSAYMFRYEESNDSWHQFTKLIASDGGSYSYFGGCVAIHSNMTIVGALNHDNSSGSAYIFKYKEINETWIEVAKLTASDANSGDRFGYAVDIYDDLTIVGESNGEGVYVFEYNPINDTWDEIVKIIGVQSADSAVTSVSIHGNLAAVGSGYDHVMRYIGKIDDLKNPSVTVKVNYNYKTSLEITGVDGNTDHVSYAIDECNRGEIFDDNISYWLHATGCFSITFYDCDDSIVDDRTDYHGSYQIEVYNVLAAVGGYYFDSETRIICTNDIYNHVSFCITPRFCNDNQQLWTHDQSDIAMTSYQAMVNSTMRLYTADEIYIGCDGDSSCYNSRFEVCDIHYPV